MRRNKNNKHNKRRSHKISAHFSKHDFSCKETSNFKISLSLIGGLELLRTRCRNRVNILLGFQSPDSPEANKLLHKKNYHTLGLAADITVDNLDIREVFKVAETIKEFKGIGHNFAEKLVHVDTRKKDDRSIWIIDENSKELEVTPENRKKYIETGQPATQ
jgi:uncharacterized protein YcbK (DUF882 family)